MSVELSFSTLAILSKVHTDLAKVIVAAARAAPPGINFQATEGRRTPERQAELFKQGATKTMHSRHLVGMAVDLVVIINGRADWTFANYARLALVIETAAGMLGVPIRWGGDWDGDGDSHNENFLDGPHFELPIAQYPDPV